MNLTTTPALAETQVFGTINYTAAGLPVTGGADKMRFTARSAQRWDNEFGPWRPTIWGTRGAVGTQIMPEGTTFEQAVRTAQSLSLKSAKIPEWGLFAWSSAREGLRDGKIAFTGPQAVAVLQAADGAYSLVPMGAFSNRREMTEVLPMPLVARFDYDADHRFGDGFKRAKNRYRDHVPATVSITREHEALQAVVDATRVVDVRSAKVGGSVPLV